MLNISNITGYKFVKIVDPYILKDTLLVKALKYSLKGTILISTKGINFSISGANKDTKNYIKFIKLDKRFNDLEVKTTYNEYKPFRKMLVRVKKEIISMGIEDINPSDFTGDKISPLELSKLLDQSNDIVLLDTRNRYEVRLGTFNNSTNLQLDSFRDFPDKIKNLKDLDKDKEIVMFCTGGIRCEKASALMLKSGFSNVKQVDGGILNYFKETGGKHWNGDCFVFDDRVALNTNLQETDYILCFRCREPLNKIDIESVRYKIDEFCPYCYDDVIQRKIK